MAEDGKKKVEEPKKTDDEMKAPVNAICDDAEENAVKLVDDESDVEPVQGFFLTSQRWH